MAIPHSKPWITGEDRCRIDQVLMSGMVGQGNVVSEFEKEIGETFGNGIPGVAVSSGTAALLMALLALECGPGDEVILPSYTCRSLLDAVLASGATPVLCDVGPCWVVDRHAVETKTSSRTKAVIVPHVYGLFAAVDEIQKVGLPVIEDCAQAIPDTSRQTVRGDLTVFSFHPTKCMTTGEGGMVVPQSHKTANFLSSLRDGNSQAGIAKTIFSPMSDIHAALGLGQFARWPAMLERRRHIASLYTYALGAHFASQFQVLEKLGAMYYRLPIRVDGGLEAYEKPFSRKGITIRRGVDELLHRLRHLPDADFPNACTAYYKTISLPIYPAMSDSEIECAVRAASDILMVGRGS